MTEFDLLVNLLVALGVGGIVGIEREHRGDPTRVVAGVRTFPLVAMAGVLAVDLGHRFGDSALPLTIGLALAGAFALALFAARHTMGVTGLTTPAAMVVTFLAGALIGFNLRIEGLIVGVATASLLVSKGRLHSIAHHLSDEEVMSAVQFITIAFVLFPLTLSLTHPLDPWGLIGPGRVADPYNVLLIVVFVSSISFASFLAMRNLGPRTGVEVSGLLGGLVNSEATTVSLASNARAQPSLEQVALVGALLATLTMFVRNLVIAAFVDLSLGVARLMLLPIALMVVGSAAASLWQERRARHEGHPTLDIKNPFAIGPAFKFGVLFLAISVLAWAARQVLGPWGVYASLAGALVSGGAVVASVGTLAATGSVDAVTAGRVAVLACVVGALNKVVILRATNSAMYRRSATAFIAVGALGLVGLVVTALLVKP